MREKANINALLREEHMESVNFSIVSLDYLHSMRMDCTACRLSRLEAGCQSLDKVARTALS
jgi:hypothetical protein